MSYISKTQMTLCEDVKNKIMEDSILSMTFYYQMIYNNKIDVCQKKTRGNAVQIILQIM